jgi:type II secretory pathway pseudopilin PulG
MIPCLTKPIRNQDGFTLVELLMAVGFSVLLLTGVYGFYNASSQSYAFRLSEQTLQDGATILLSKMIEGETESGSVYRLATAVSYMIPNGSANQQYTCGGSPQSAPCNAYSPFSELYYCQDSPCGGYYDNTSRWYYLNSSGSAVLYHHPIPGGKTVEETVYTAPTGSVFTLRFSPAQINGQLQANVVEIDVALIKNTFTTGSASTFVLMRDHP